MDDSVHSLLLIDDEPFVRDSLAAYLEDSGYRVLEAGDGQQGLMMFEQCRPDLVLLDLKMPNMDGLELLRKLGDHPSHTPVIVISGASVMNDVVQALRYGASDYLIKPIADMEMLEHAVARGLEQGRLRRENERYRQQLEEANRELRESLFALQQDQQAGRHVQMKMLPPSPKRFGDYRFSHRIVPSLYLSGDFIDYFTVGTEHVVFFIADVSGHGASSAFVTVLLKNLFARKRSDYTHRADPAILSPASMLDRANRELMATDIGKHVTLVVGCLDLRSGELCYSIAGHLPLPIFSSERRARFLEGRNPPVGLFEDAEYHNELVQLPRTFTLTLFSDGILEVLSAEGLEAKEQQLLQALSRGRRSVNRVFAALDLEEIGEAPDDIALLLITRTEKKVEVDAAR